MFELKNILIITSVVLICSLVLPGCLKAEDIQVKDFKWTELSSNYASVEHASFEMTINSDYEGDVFIKDMTFDGQDVRCFDSLVHKGENLIQGKYLVHIGNDLTTKKQGELSIMVERVTVAKAIDIPYLQIDNRWRRSSGGVTVAKVIDMPYLGVEMIPSNTVIHKQGDYLTLRNTGNIQSKFSVKNKQTYIFDGGEPTGDIAWFTSGIVPEVGGGIFGRVKVDPQESIKIPLQIWCYDDCYLEEGDMGTDIIQVIVAYSNGERGKELVISEIPLTYIYQ